MHILITGGTGLVGAHLVPALLSDNHTVTVLTRNPKPSSLQGLRFAAWDGKSIPEDVQGVDALINLAGAGIADERWTDRYKKLIADSRVHATSACVAFIQRQAVKPQVFISASAVGYYGTHRKEVLGEDAGAGTDFLSGVGRKWEMAAVGADCRTVVFRLGVILAKEGGAFPKLIAPFKLYAGGPIGSGEQGMPWVHIEDVVGAMTFALLNNTMQGTYNLVAPDVKNNRQFAMLVGKVMDRPTAVPVPIFAVQLLLGESHVLVTEGQKVTAAKLLGTGYRFKYAEAEGALRELVKE